MKNKYEIKGENVYVYLDKNQFTIINKEYFEKVSSIKGTWCAYKSKKSNKFYARAGINIDRERKNIKLHRFIMNLQNQNLVIHHKNGDSLDNRINNLYVCTIKQHNALEKKTGLVSDNYAVSYETKRNRWRVQARINGKVTYMGIYKTEREAIEAYKKHKVV